MQLLQLWSHFASATPRFIPRLLTNSKKKLEQKVNQRIDQKTNSAMDKMLDKAEDVGKTNTTTSSNNNNNATTKDQLKNTSYKTTDKNNVENEPAGLKSYSKFDFLPGDKIIAMDDFSGDAVGDFPAKWNTNGSGEVVTLNSRTGHWLMINKRGRFVPMSINSLPENFTLEFDLLSNQNFNYYSTALQLFFLDGSNDKKVFEYSFLPIEKRSGIKLGIHPYTKEAMGSTVYLETYENGEKVINNEVTAKSIEKNADKYSNHISLWRQKQRVRVYINEEKVFDLPRAFPLNKNYNLMMWELWADMNRPEDQYLISNIKLAAGAPDTRSKLLTEGKFSTTGILFDVNSEKIKPESYGVLKDIAGVLTENPELKIRVIGHTDSDGDAAKNMDLSKRRAASVKKALNSEFGIDDSRITTDGKGASLPVAKNDSPEGKAQNRRVEFIKE